MSLESVATIALCLVLGVFCISFGGIGIRRCLRAEKMGSIAPSEVRGFLIPACLIVSFGVAAVAVAWIIYTVPLR